MTIYGILCGLTDFTNIADFLKIKEDYFTQLLNLEHGTPSHDCLSDVFVAIDSKKFMEIFIEWTKEIIKKKNKQKYKYRWKSSKVSNRSDKRWKHTIYSISVFRRCGIINRSSKS